MEDDIKLKELFQQRERERQILRENEETYLKCEQSKYSNEQIEQAQEETAKKQINDLYFGKVFPYTNAVMYFIYYLASLVLLPFVYYGNMIIPSIIAWSLLLVMTIVSRAIERKIRADIVKESKYIKILIRFSDQTAMFCYILTSLGYLTSIMTSIIFWGVYLFMILLFLISIVYAVVKPICNVKS